MAYQILDDNSENVKFKCKIKVSVNKVSVNKVTVNIRFDSKLLYKYCKG